MNRMFGVVGLFFVLLVLVAIGAPACKYKGLDLPPCPNTALGETALDCPWASIARALQTRSAEGKDLSTPMNEVLPTLMAQIKADGKKDSWKALWGESINYDELAHGTVVQVPILNALAKSFDVAPPQVEDVRGEIVHAGMEHTYGYLFSTLQTSFGYKRARWVQDDIEVGFGLPRGTLGPTPAEGSLFSNVTYFAGNIAFRTEPGILEILRQGSDGVAKAVRDFDFSKLNITRLEETVDVPSAGGAIRSVKIRTDFVDFLNIDAKRPNQAWLVYSIDDPAKSNVKLVTAFPIAGSFKQMALNPANLGEKKPVLSRYNGYVQGLSGANPPLLGTRQVLTAQ